MEKKKFFIFGDVHSYYDIFINALTESGYDYNNENHWLISLGDNFDRGSQSNEMYSFLMNKNKRTILLRGNHENLLLSCIERGYTESFDYSNGTVKTILDLGGEMEHYNNFFVQDKTAYNKACDITYGKLKPVIDEMPYYFETKNYIFVHSWIPVKMEVSDEDIEKYGIMAYNNPQKSYDENWRTAYKSDWESATWFNPFMMAHDGLNQTGKTIVSGHWHTSWPRNVYDGADEDDKKNFKIYRDEINKHIGIDACTAYSEKVNILVVEDEFMEEENG